MGQWILEEAIAALTKFKEKYPNLSAQQAAFKLEGYPSEIKDFILWQYNPKVSAKFGRFAPHILPSPVSVEQASSEQTALFKLTLTHDDTVADLSGGAGMDSMAFATRAKKVYHIEQNPVLQSIAKYNFSAMGFANIESICMQAEHFVDISPVVDWVYLDPDRRVTVGAGRVALSHSSPNILEIKTKLWNIARKGILVKASPMIDISLACKELGNVSEVIVLGVDGQCKELIFVIRRETQPIIIKAIELNKSEFSFFMAEEAQSQATYSTIEQYLYEPWACVMKAAPFKLLSYRFRINKLAVSTHLYTSQNPVKGFPGRTFRVVGLLPFRPKPGGLTQANLTVRNFPMSSDSLRKKLEISDGGEDYLFACTLQDNKKVLVHCRKV